MIYTIIGIGFLFSLSLNLYFLVSKPNISVEDALKRIKKNLIRVIVFYQDNYNVSDQVVLIATWISDNIKHKSADIPKSQKKLLKELVNEL